MKESELLKPWPWITTEEQMCRYHSLSIGCSVVVNTEKLEIAEDDGIGACALASP